MIGPVVALILVILAYATGNTEWLQRGGGGKHYQSQKKNTTDNPIPPGMSFDGALEGMQNDRLIFTKHAKCRMGCRHIDREEIDEILANGKINQRKSNLGDSPCPTFAVEGVTHDNQTVRIVFADCGRETKVITAIDLKNHYKCHCK